jgi:hypothetical protein
MVRFTTAIIGLHPFEILLWTGFYRWLCFPLWESAFYFSTSSYATVDYGDIVLPQMWRTLGPLESVIGGLMYGLSASFLFFIVTRLVDREARLSANWRSPLQELISTQNDSNLSGRSRGGEKEVYLHTWQRRKPMLSLAFVDLRPSK